MAFNVEDYLEEIRSGKKNPFGEKKSGGGFGEYGTSFREATPPAPSLAATPLAAVTDNRERVATVLAEVGAPSEAPAQ